MFRANLSIDYFANCQDRYYVFSDKPLTNFYANIHNAICRLSYELQPDADSALGFELVWPDTNFLSVPLDQAGRTISELNTIISPLIKGAYRKTLEKDLEHEG